MRQPGGPARKSDEERELARALFKRQRAKAHAEFLAQQAGLKCMQRASPVEDDDACLLRCSELPH